MAMTPSRSDAASALVGGRAHGASTAVVAAAMPRSPRRRCTDTVRRPVLFVLGQCLKVRHGHVARGILVEVVIVEGLAGGHRFGGGGGGRGEGEGLCCGTILSTYIVVGAVVWPGGTNSYLANLKTWRAS